jgi:glycosyltransferase involved in cell wall biosynthesis
MRNVRAARGRDRWPRRLAYHPARRSRPMTALPSLSVVIPTHNRAGLLPRAVESALTVGAEVVVVDDASTDETPDVGAAYARSGVTYERVSVNHGPCLARNLGVSLTRGDLVLFLDDDDELLPNGGDVIRCLAEAHPGYDLYLHNCRYSDGRVSMPDLKEPAPVGYRDWLDGRWEHELKPVIRRRLFDAYEYDDTGASGEGLLWGRVIRDRGALAGPVPVVTYDTSGLDRLTSAVGLLANAHANARIAEQWLAYFGKDLKQADPLRWAGRIETAALYAVLSGERDEARRLVRSVPHKLLSNWSRMAIVFASRMPLPLVRLAFLVYRRELVPTVGHRRLANALFPRAR